jgi:hypothetical protein
VGAGADAAAGADAGAGPGGLPHADFMVGFDDEPLPGADMLDNTLKLKSVVCNVSARRLRRLRGVGADLRGRCVQT